MNACTASCGSPGECIRIEVALGDDPDQLGLAEPSLPLWLDDAVGEAIRASPVEIDRDFARIDREYRAGVRWHRVGVPDIGGANQRRRMPPHDDDSSTVQIVGPSPSAVSMASNRAVHAGGQGAGAGSIAALVWSDLCGTHAQHGRDRSCAPVQLRRCLDPCPVSVADDEQPSAVRTGTAS